jgi:hypothetical protein
MYVYVCIYIYIIASNTTEHCHTKYGTADHLCCVFSALCACVLARARACREKEERESKRERKVTAMYTAECDQSVKRIWRERGGGAERKRERRGGGGGERQRMTKKESKPKNVAIRIL